MCHMFLHRPYWILHIHLYHSTGGAIRVSLYQIYVFTKMVTGMVTSIAGHYFACTMFKHLKYNQ